MSRYLGAPAPAYTTLTNTGSVTSGSTRWVVVNGLCYIDVNVGFTSVSAGTSVTIVAVGGLPAAVCPQTTKRGYYSISTTIGRLDINSDGSIVATPLTGSGGGAVGYAVFPAGL